MIAGLNMMIAATDGLSTGEKVLLAVGGVMTLALIVLFIFILRMASKDDGGGPGDTREKK